jgi:hypothetical protein
VWETAENVCAPRIFAPPAAGSHNRHSRRRAFQDIYAVGFVRIEPLKPPLFPKKRSARTHPAGSARGQAFRAVLSCPPLQEVARLLAPMQLHFICALLTGGVSIDHFDCANQWGLFATKTSRQATADKRNFLFFIKSLNVPLGAAV